jgi:hypothetical protein
MAEVDMPDAESSAPLKAKPLAKSTKSGGAVESSLDGKKRFEVKKVYYCQLSTYY